MDDLSLDEQLVSVENETRELNAELRKLDTSFSARIAELKAGSGEEAS